MSVRHADIHHESPLGRGLDIEQRIVAGLDRQRIGGGPDSWMAYVLGVHVDGATIWIQIARNEDADESVIVRMRADAAPGDVLDALTRIAPQADASPVVVVVGPPER
jgi:hypothetical protein